MKNKKREFKRMNKRGAEMTIGTIVVIILALVVLVVVIYGFTQGWDNLLRKLGIMGGGKVNVQDTINACTLACNTNLQYEYCEKQRQVIFKDGDKAKPYSCLSLQQREGATIGLEQCMAISCATSAQKGGKACKTGWKGEWLADCAVEQKEISTIISVGGINIKLISDSDINENNPTVAGTAGTKKCCVKQDKCDGTISGTWLGTCDATQYDVTSTDIITLTDKTEHSSQRCCVA